MLQSLVVKYIHTVINRKFIVSILFFFMIFLLFYSMWSPLYYLVLKDYDIFFVAPPNETLLKKSIFEIIIQALVLAPLIETFLFQKLLYHVLSTLKFLERNKIYIVLIGAFLFGIIHFYTLSYIIYNFFIGIFFMSAYVLKRHKHGYWVVVIFHALCNAFAVLIDPIEQNIFGGH